MLGGRAMLEIIFLTYVKPSFWNDIFENWSDINKRNVFTRISAVAVMEFIWNLDLQRIVLTMILLFAVLN